VGIISVPNVRDMMIGSGLLNNWLSVSQSVSRFL